jgi:hypothetical protein
MAEHDGTFTLPRSAASCRHRTHTVLKPRPIRPNPRYIVIDRLQFKTRGSAQGKNLKRQTSAAIVIK